MWDATKGKRHQGSSPADLEWHTNTCVLSYWLMGMWPPGAAGNDINAVDVCHDLGLCINGDDDGKFNLLAYPSIVKNAPKKVLAAHSSHVMNVKFIQRQSGWGAVTLGGRDTTVVVWNIDASR